MMNDRPLDSGPNSSLGTPGLLTAAHATPTVVISGSMPSSARPFYPANSSPHSITIAPSPLAGSTSGGSGGGMLGAFSGTGAGGNPNAVVTPASVTVTASVVTSNGTGTTPLLTATTSPAITSSDMTTTATTSGGRSPRDAPVAGNGNGNGNGNGARMSTTQGTPKSTPLHRTIGGRQKAIDSARERERGAPVPTGNGGGGVNVQMGSMGSMGSIQMDAAVSGGVPAMMAATASGGSFTGYKPAGGATNNNGNATGRDSTPKGTPTLGPMAAPPAVVTTSVAFAAREYQRPRPASGNGLHIEGSISNHLPSAGQTQGQQLYDALLRVADSTAYDDDADGMQTHNTTFVGGRVQALGRQGTHNRNNSGMHGRPSLGATEAAAVDLKKGDPGSAYAITIDREREKRELEAKREAEARRKNSPPITLVSFNERLKPFKALLLISGLHKDTSAWYRWWLRIVIWSCTALCITNLFFRTRAYRSILFDIALGLMHIWVSVAYEYWYRFLKKKHWQYLLCNQPSYEFFKVLAILGYVGIVGIIGATVVITIGWIAPILVTFFDLIPQYSVFRVDTVATRDFYFLALHGLWMTIIVTSWACVCITSMFLFFLLIQAHKSDIDGYARQVVTLFADNGSIRMSNAAAAAVVQLIVPVRRRLAVTSRYFNHLSASFVMGFFLLIVGSAQNVSDILNGVSHPDVYKAFQDTLFFGLGVAALFCGLWAASSLAGYWTHTVHVLNAIPTLAPVASAGMITLHTGGTAGQAAGSFGPGGAGAERTGTTVGNVTSDDKQLLRERERPAPVTGLSAADLVVHSAVIQHLQVHPICFSIYGLDLSKSAVMALTFAGVQVLAVLIFILNYPTH